MIKMINKKDNSSKKKYFFNFNKFMDQWQRVTHFQLPKLWMGKQLQQSKYEIGK